MKLWLTLMMACMSIGVAFVSARLAEKAWGKEIRSMVFIIVFLLLWICFWLGTL